MDHVCAGALGACDGGVVTDSIQRSDCHVDPLCTHVKPTAIEIPQNLWQASTVEANICYLSLCNPYGMT